MFNNNKLPSVLKDLAKLFNGLFVPGLPGVIVCVRAARGASVPDRTTLQGPQQCECL